MKESNYVVCQIYMGIDSLMTFKIFMVLQLLVDHRIFRGELLN